MLHSRWNRGLVGSSFGTLKPDFFAPSDLADPFQRSQVLAGKANMVVAALLHCYRSFSSSDLSVEFRTVEVDL